MLTAYCVNDTWLASSVMTYDRVPTLHVRVHELRTEGNTLGIFPTKPFVLQSTHMSKKKLDPIRSKPTIRVHGKITSVDGTI